MNGSLLLLSRARSTKPKSASFNLAKFVVDEADKALALEPRDPEAHILKAMAQSLMGHKTSALKSLDTALSPPAVKKLSDGDKRIALSKGAELKIDLNPMRRVDSAMEDLVEVIRLGPNNTKAFCLMGHCYEIKGLEDEA